MESGKVFISSILRREVEDLSADRAAVKEAVESFGFLRAWAFENTPASIEPLDQSYLRHVDECDLFIVLVGSKITEPVTGEILRAKRGRKSILAFAKSVQERSSEAEMALEGLGRKYAEFCSVAELQEKTRSAIGETMVLALRSYSPVSPPLSVEEQLQKILLGRVCLSPSMPRDDRQEYTVERIASGKVYLGHGPKGQQLEVPIARITEVLPLSNSEPYTLLLAGRVQWITAKAAWKFCPEALPSDSSLGLSRDSVPGGPEAFEIPKKLGQSGYVDFLWDWRWNLSERLRTGWEVFYGDDGRYLSTVLMNGEQLYLVKRLRSL